MSSESIPRFRRPAMTRHKMYATPCRTVECPSQRGGTIAMRLYRTKKGFVAEEEGRAGLLPDRDWDALFNRKSLGAYLAKTLKAAKPLRFDPDSAPLLAPIGSQEVWA